jgi:hypothetical protein
LNTALLFDVNAAIVGWLLLAVQLYKVGSITNANGPISQQLRNIAQKFKKAAQTTFISCAEKKVSSASVYCRLSTCLCVKQVSGPRSVFRLPECGGNDATEELASALAKYKNTSKQIHNIVNGAFLNKGLSLSQCYRIVETVKKGKSLEEMKDQRNKNPTKTWRTVEDRVLGHKLYQSLAASSLQSRFGSCRLFSLLENKE